MCVACHEQHNSNSEQLRAQINAEVGISPRKPAHDKTKVLTRPSSPAYSTASESGAPYHSRLHAAPTQGRARSAATALLRARGGKGKGRLPQERVAELEGVIRTFFSLAPGAPLSLDLLTEASKMQPVSPDLFAPEVGPLPCSPTFLPLSQRSCLGRAAPRSPRRQKASLRLGDLSWYR